MLASTMALERCTPRYYVVLVHIVDALGLSAGTASLGRTRIRLLVCGDEETHF